MKLLLATRNRDKVREIRSVLADLNVELLCAADMPDLPEVEEDADTLEGNAIKKALTLHQLTGLPTLADDTGLEVEALGGVPGVYSSRYAGPGATYDDNVQKLLQAMRDVPTSRRQAQFRTVVAFAHDGNVETVEGVCRGVITTEPRGSNNFGYDPIFFVPELGKTMAEMTLAEKNRISHRGKAFREIKKNLTNYLSRSR
ncbi:MAG: XTP/dITP diphosphatase [candidate division KSB1 bacterium]|nr:XTP/dITP diphosphatase [candidate division KSB1 bacterium]MDQ7064897.1 XTP/dITP diphosphatase [candidate division KSB1 bacterium]